jgi:uncharacterized protein YtpQ (UPF0354 family)
MKRIWQIILTAFGLCSGCSESGIITPQQFTQEFADALRKSSAGLKVEVVRDLELKVTPPGGRDFGAFLSNAYDMYKQKPKTKAEVIQRFIAGTLEAAGGLPKGVDRTRIVPIIKDRNWPVEARQEMVRRGKEVNDFVYEDFNSDLVIVYAQDSPKNISYLTPKDLEKARIGRGELKAIACENLKRLLPKIERRGGEGLYMVTAGGDYEASLLVLDPIWTDGQMRVRGDFVVAVPTRDLLLVTGTEEPQGIQKVRQLAREALAREFSYRLTPKLFVYREGKFEPFGDTSKILDANAPILKIDSAHQMMNYPTGTTPELYHFAACSTVILDATDYSFDIPPEIRNRPLNLIHVVLDKTRQYQLEWQPGKMRYELSKSTLQPLKGSEPFEGFKTGDKIALAIGVVFAPGHFAPVWTSLANVE